MQTTRMSAAPTEPGEQAPGETPRTDLPPTREPYDDGYFGTEEEEGVVREREVSGDHEGEEEGGGGEGRRAEERAGGDREI